jgi:hypothetical protein
MLMKKKHELYQQAADLENKRGISNLGSCDYHGIGTKSGRFSPYGHTSALPFHNV